MRAKTKEAPEDIITKHLGIIAGRCLYYWRMLPPSVRAGYDPEDMISDTVLHVWTRLTTAKYQTSRGASSTFVWHVSNNYCQVLLGKYSCKKRGAGVTVPMPETPLTVSGPNRMKILESRDAVERVLQYSSESALELLDRLFTQSSRRPRATPEAIKDLRACAREQHATLADFETVYCLFAQ